MRTFLAGLVGGVILFVWGAVMHMATPLGEMGLSWVPADKEPALIEALKGALTERKIYMVPGGDWKNMSEAEMEVLSRKMEAGPNALVVYNPGAGVTSMGTPMALEFLTSVLVGLVMAFVVANLAAGTGYGKRVLIVALIGLSASLAVDVSYWIWYRYPSEYLAAQLVGNSVGGLLAGLGVAKLALKPAG